jgi:hypothetical protein
VVESALVLRKEVLKGTFVLGKDMAAGYFRPLKGCGYRVSSSLERMWLQYRAFSSSEKDIAAGVFSPSE